jgi:hypothetical protein
MTDPTSEAWEAYQRATATYKAMQAAGTPQSQLFSQAVLVNRLQRDFAATFNRVTAQPGCLRLVGGLDADQSN